MVSENRPVPPASAAGRSKRPRIPAAIAREVLIESGHRCAVCGDGCPLERAHIISWQKSREHSVENLICLCASCHQRADLEKWGARTLLEYKRRPWILRKATDALAVTPQKLIQLTLEMEFESFDARTERLLVHALAGLLDIPPTAVKILAVERGSVKILLQLPVDAAERLLQAKSLGDISLQKYLNAVDEIRISEVFVPAATTAVASAVDRLELPEAASVSDKTKDKSLVVPISDTEDEVTQVLLAWSEGDAAALEKLMPLVHEELHRIARPYCEGEDCPQPTELVNEVYLRLVDRRKVQWRNQAQFFGFAANLMRHILVDHARGRQKSKSGHRPLSSLGGDVLFDLPKPRELEILRVDAALKALAREDERQARIVEMRFFAGLTNEEIGEALGISSATVKREWATARLFLLQELAQGSLSDRERWPEIKPILEQALKVPAKERETWFARLDAEPTLVTELQGILALWRSVSRWARSEGPRGTLRA